MFSMLNLRIILKEKKIKLKFEGNLTYQTCLIFFDDRFKF